MGIGKRAAEHQMTKQEEEQRQIDAAWEEYNKTHAYCPDCARSCDCVDFTFEMDAVYECLVCGIKFTYNIVAREQNGN